LSASGDSAGVDVPASSPYVTSVGGTVLHLNGSDVENEVAWYYSGSGVSRSMKLPWWQVGIPGVGARRTGSDVALNAETDYWYLWLGEWRPNTGTSFGSPIFAGILACVNSGRMAQGKPVVGHLNPLMYTDLAVQRTFRDITVGGTDQYRSTVGWDPPTGWGAPNGMGLLNTLP
jgi:kumamolisin